MLNNKTGPHLKPTDTSEGVLSGLDDCIDKKECYIVRDKQEESGRAGNHPLSFVWMPVWYRCGEMLLSLTSEALLTLRERKRGGGGKNKEAYCREQLFLCL